MQALKDLSARKPCLLEMVELCLTSTNPVLVPGLSATSDYARPLMAHMKALLLLSVGVCVCVRTHPDSKLSLWASSTSNSWLITATSSNQAALGCQNLHPQSHRNHLPFLGQSFGHLVRRPGPHPRFLTREGITSLRLVVGMARTVANSSGRHAHCLAQRRIRDRTRSQEEHSFSARVRRHSEILGAWTHKGSNPCLGQAICVCVHIYIYMHICLCVCVFLHALVYQGVRLLHDGRRNSA